MSTTTIRKRYIALGLLIALILFYVLFANTIIKSILSKELGKAHGAEVNIASVDHSLFPTKIEIKGIELTDAVTPSKNQVFIGEASADVDLASVFSPQVVVDQLSLLDVEFGTTRAAPGEVYRQPSHAFSWDELKQQASDAIPSVDEVLARSPLKTTAAVEKAQADYARYEESLQQQYQELPKQERIAEYKEKIEALKKVDYKDPQQLAKAKQTLDEIKAAIREDKAVISQFTDSAKAAKEALQASVQELKTAPQQDYQLLQGLIAGDQAAMQQVTQALFGEQAAKYTEYLTAALQIVLPMLTDTAAEDTATESGTPLSVLVKQANMSVKWQDETISSVWKNITDNHIKAGQPTTFTIEAAGNLLKQFTSQGQFWIDDKGVDAEQKWSIDGLNLSDLDFSQPGLVNALVKAAVVASQGSMQIVDNKLSGASDVDLRQLLIDASGDTKLGKSIAGVLNNLSSLNVGMSLAGSLSDPQFVLNSSLDGKFAEMAMASLSDEQKQKLDQLKQKLNAIALPQTQQGEAQLGDITSMLSAASGDSASLDELLKAQLSGLLESKKSDLLKKLGSKFGGE